MYFFSPHRNKALASHSQEAEPGLNQGVFPSLGYLMGRGGACAGGSLELLQICGYSVLPILSF